MSLESVQGWLQTHAPDLRVIEGHGSTATVADAAATLGVEPGRIAKSLALRVYGDVLLLVTRGDARLDMASARRHSVAGRGCWMRRRYLPVPGT